MEKSKLNYVKLFYVQEFGKQAKVKKASEMPKLAPQLDGLNCFETLMCPLSAWFLWLISSSAACRGGC